MESAESPASIAFGAPPHPSPPAATANAGAAAWYGLAILLLTTLFAFVARQMLSLIAPSLQASLGFGDLQIGMLQGLGMAVFASLASYPFGWLADRYGRRRILAIGVGCWSLATGFCAFQSSFAGLFLGTVGIAIGEAGLAPIIFAMIPDLFPERQRNTANFIFYGGSMLGSGLGMALGGAMLHWLAGAPQVLPAWLAGVDTWRIAMMAVALFGPLFTLLVTTMPLGQGMAGRTAATVTGKAAARAFLPYARAHWRTLSCIFGSIFSMGVAMQSCVMWFPLALPRAFGIDPTTVGLGLGTAIMIATLIGILLPPLALGIGQRARLDPIRLAASFIFVAPVPAAFLPFVGSALQAYVLAAIIGAAGIAASSLMPGLLQDLAPAHLRSRVLALLGITNGLALAVSPIAIGAVSSLMTGPRGMLQAMTVIALPFLLASALFIALAPAPYAATVRAVRSMFPGEDA